MTPLLTLLGYLACCFAAYRLFLADWQRQFSTMTRGDFRAIYWFAIAGPISLVVGIIIWLTGRPGTARSKEIVWRKNEP